MQPPRPLSAVELQLTASHENLMGRSVASVMYHPSFKGQQIGGIESSNNGSINPSYQSADDAKSYDDDNGHKYMTECSPSQITPPRSEVQSSGEHDRPITSASHSLSNRSTESALRVEIADIDGEESLNLTTTQLKRCKRQVLRPYWRLLMFIGWRGFGREYVNSSSLGWKVLNTLYPLFIILMLFFTYAYEIIACQWKLNVDKDTKTVTTTVPPTQTTQPQNISTPGWFPYISMEPAKIDINAWNLSDAQGAYPMACEHIITTYAVPNALHFLAFAMGVYHFRIQESEHLYALMERVFLLATPLHNRSASQQKMIRNMRRFFLAGAVWVLSTLGMQALYEWAFDFPKLAFFMSTGPLVHWFLFVIELFGILVINSIFVAVVTNYYTQCEMILFYVKAINVKLQEKSTDLKTAMKDILSVRQNLSVLNGPIARMTALVSVIFAELTVIGVSILVLNKNDQFKVWVYRSLFPVIWFVILAIPLMQAARVNSVCKRFKKIALEIRVFGYKGSSLLELDSFLNFVGHGRLRAKLFHISILPSYLIAFVVVSLFVLLILMQTGIIGASHFF